MNFTFLGQTESCPKLSVAKFPCAVISAGLPDTRHAYTSVNPEMVAN